MKKKIAVFGCGWLGLPLAKILIEQDYSINGSTTTKAKLSVLEENNISPFLIDLNLDLDEKAMISFLYEVEILIINIPPRMKIGKVANYASKMKKLYQHVKKSDIKKVLFVSSTSVYGEIEGEVTEQTIPSPLSESGKELLKAENIFKEDVDLQTTIVRFGGLIGLDRHPVYQLSKKKEIQNGNFPINLIHLNDCISIIDLIIKKKYWGELFNAVYPHHPTKSVYYTEKAKEKGLEIPNFIENQQKIGKKISSYELIYVKNYEFFASI